MLPTPSTSHVDVDRVYEPAEDSFLFLDTLSSAAETSFLRKRFSKDREPTTSPLVVEVGIGSGVILAFVTAHAQTIFGRSDVLSLGVDINPFACEASIQTVEKASRGVAKGSHDESNLPETGFFLTSVNANLTSVVRPRTVDVLIFNPPYVPTIEVPQIATSPPQATNDGVSKEYEMQGSADGDGVMLSLSYAGGADGMEVTNRLLEQLSYTLQAERGIAYILLCKQNKPEEVIQRIQKWGTGWEVDVVGRSGKHGGWEKLQIFRISRGTL
ncbi:MAG: hypothetical protein Q9170_001849 [Blastenia crenularia]